ncbi:non-ribosomal peptide synthetase [Paenibacillus gorillae]|uniref:non-ribosomal peptide synthetase n=1 Tax=Paenibacillus gorillae TaxID=1243662 RepID=UPI0004B9FB08|nr:non-ribosomal peptide synthetase [Paenibacillus gorillae]
MKVFEQFFILVNGEPKQKVCSSDQLNIKLEFVDLSITGGEQKANEFAFRDKDISFDLSEGPLIRAKLFRIENDKHIFYINVHHIVSDGWSSKVFLSELVVSYNAFVNNKENPLSPLRIQYKDYSAWQNASLQGDKLEQLRSYWTNQFSGELPILELPTDKLRPAIQKYDGDRISFTFDNETTLSLKDFCRKNDVTLFMVLLAATNVLLNKYTGQSDIAIGSPIAGRQNIELEDQIGCYVNTIVFRSRFEVSAQFKQFLKQIKKLTLDAYEHQLYPFEQLVEELNIKKDLSRSPIFNVMLVLQNTDAAGTQEFMKNLTISGIKDLGQSSIFDLHLEFIEQNGLIGNITYNRNLFNEYKIEMLCSHFRNILQIILNYEEIQISDINMLTEQEIYKQLVTWNNTDYYFDNLESIPLQFLEQVNKNPNKVAMVFNNQSLTYLELHEKSDRLASYLRNKGIGSDSIVGIMVERSFEMIIGIMGILKSGGAYLPIDPDYPNQRIDYMIQDSGITILLTTKVFESKTNSECEFIYLDNINSFMHEAKNLPISYDTSSLAYIIYTSGSTGKPKGVKIEQRSLINRLNWMQRCYPIYDSDVIMHKTPYVFDVSVWEILWWAVTGGTVVILNPGEEKDLQSITKAVEQYQVTTLHFVPSMLHIFLDFVDNFVDLNSLSSIKQVFVSGEVLGVEDVNTFNRLLFGTNRTVLVNLYGPTEATIDVSYFHCSTDELIEKVPIGKPIDNTKLYVLDSHLQLQPVGVQGELYISGAGLARGYTGKDKMTSERFIDNPYEVGKTFYKTGDLVKWNIDGNMEYIGRIDQQVKIRGFRIELEEIRAELVKYANIQEAVVIACEDEGERYLTAFYTSRENRTVEEIVHYLRSKLPGYMIPSRLIRLHQIPVTKNGKVNIAELARVNNAFVGDEENYVEASNYMEKKLSEIWSDVLGLEIIGTKNNFFEIGGDSIKALRISIALQREGIHIELKDIFLHQTVKELSEYIQQSSLKSDLNLQLSRETDIQSLLEQMDSLKFKIISSLVNPEVVEDVYPMSDIETGLLFHTLKNPGSLIHHIQFVYQAQFNNFDMTRFKQAVSFITDRHEALRCFYNIQDYDVPVKIIHKKIEMDINYCDISYLTDVEQEEWLLKYLEEDKCIPFEFDKAPIWRMRVIEVGEGKLIFLFIFHQAIMDGWSNATLMSDISETYVQLEANGEYRPSKLNNTYKQFVLEQIFEKRKESNITFWKSELHDHVKDNLIELSCDKNNLSEVTSYRYRLPREDLEQILNIAKDLETSMKVICFSVYVKLISSIHGKENIVVSILTHNRPICEESDKIIGFFLNMVPVKLTINNDVSWEDHIKMISNKLLLLKEF